MDFRTAAIGIGLLAFTWVLYKLKKLKRLENKEFLDEVYKNAEHDIGNQSLDELVRDTNEDREKRHRSH